LTRIHKIPISTTPTQATLRGWRVRRVQGLKFRMLRSRVREANARAEADPSLRIGARHEAALEVLLTSRSCSHILHCCKTLGGCDGLCACSGRMVGLVWFGLPD